AANALNLNGANASIAGSAGAAIITGSGTINMNSSKNILTGTDLTIQPIINLAANTTVTNGGTITHTNNLTGANATTSIWVNDANSFYSVTGSVLTTGVLNTDAIPNSIDYNGAGA